METGLLAAAAWSGLDTTILIAFFVALVGIVVWVLSQKEETSQDYFLAGRNAGWVSIGSSIFASNIGSEHLVGLAGAGFVSGMAMAHWEMHAWLILVLGWVFVPFYDRIKIFTMPEYLELRFSPGSRSVLSLISLVSYVLTKVAVTVYSGGVVFGTVFGINRVPENVPLIGGMDMFWVSAIGLVVITGLYTVLGGMKAVMYTSVLQTPVLLIGSIVILIIGLVKVGGWGEVERICGPNLHLVRPASDPEFPWTGVLFGSMIIGFWYWCTDQYIVQRVLSAKNQKEARRGSILAAYFKLLPVFIFLVPGMIAYALAQKGLLDIPLTAEGKPNADSAFSVMVSQLLPIGFKGFVVCGLLAALMSSLASLFNSSAALFVGDFYKKLRPNASEKHLVMVGRIATATVVILGIVWIPVMKGMGNVLYRYLQNVQGLLAPAIAAAFLMGVFSKRATSMGGFSGLVIGFVLGMFRLTLDVFKDRLTEGTFLYWVADVNWLHYCEFLFVICLLVTIVVSLMTRPPSKEQLRYTYYAATPEEKAATRASWNKWDVIHTLIILGVIVSFYIYFW
ncbi:MAG TPA: sodium:solute symporter [Anaerohalosphaeraceae bacterium]|jgi:SSS family solute:Na+ symporter|nr:sodium:solute symporter [Anaerohalosphaeraceae bacterium]HQG05322.1 sodium:solute symporter [Anaerohalosphaeraceae bacterium]HQI08142.1 sodium:solute symporter [Anaerohalosphaeraceae bacterium]HQJ66736.1 sodium:solute symporter [Anaerohalosphaeraceae bacterium]HRS72839.1 sodium:solute symporter [Anaerohalosphaeraceae bacterium]